MLEQIGRVGTHWIRDLKISRSNPTAGDFFFLGGGTSFFFHHVCVFNIFCSFVCSFFSTFKRWIMYDSISRIPCTFLGQRTIEQILINERFCFISNSKFDSPGYFPIPQNSTFLILRPHPFSPLSTHIYSIYPFSGISVLDKKNKIKSCSHAFSHLQTLQSCAKSIRFRVIVDPDGSINSLLNRNGF